MKNTLFFNKAIRFLFPICIGLILSGCIAIPGMPDSNSTLTPKNPGSVPNSDFKLIKLGYSNIKYFSQPSKSHTKKKVRSKKRVFKQKGHARSVGGYTYLIGSQDILSISVWGQTELTMPSGGFQSPEAAGHRVNKQGDFFFPFAGKIKAVGKTTEQVRLDLTRKLSKYYPNPQVRVSIAAYKNQRASISGQVMKPSIFEINDIPLTVRDMIAKAGGLRSLSVRNNGVSRNKSKSYGSGNYNLSYTSSGSNAFEKTESPEKALLTRMSSKKKILIDLKALFEKGDKSQNYVLHGGDSLHIFLPEHQQQEDSEEALIKLRKVFVLGEVKKSGTIVMDDYGSSLAEALSERGGINENTANAKGIFVVRSDAKSKKRLPIVFQLELKGVHSMILAEKFALHERDIVYVTAAPVSRWNRIITQILPSLNTATSVDNLTK